MKTSSIRRLNLSIGPSVAILAWVVASVAPVYATVPGHNGVIAFSANTGAGYQIYTVRGNGHDLNQITNVSGDAVRPHWSPDGTQIVFEFDTATSTNVAILNADGSGLVNLPPLPNGFEDTPSFTSDGKRILFHRFEFNPCCDDAIWSMNLEGNDRLRIIGLPNGTYEPETSPNGQNFSFLGFNGQPFGQALFTAAIDGSHLFQLTDKHDWAPDGQHIVFTNNSDFPHPGDSANIATIRPDGTSLRFLTHYQGGKINAFVGSYSPDGRWIVFRIEDHGSFGLFKMHPDGSDLRTILGLSSFKPRFIAWGPQSSEEEDEDNEGNPVSASGSPALTQGNPMPSGIVTSWRALLSQRYHIPALQAQGDRFTRAAGTGRYTARIRKLPEGRQGLVATHLASNAKKRSTS